MTHKEEDEPFPEREPELAELRLREVFVVVYVLIVPHRNPCNCLGVDGVAVCAAL